MDAIFDGLLEDSDEEIAAVQVCIAAVQAAGQAATEGNSSSGDQERGWAGRFVGSKRKSARGVCAWFDLYLSPSPTYTSAHFLTLFRVPLRLYRALERELPLVAATIRKQTDCTGRLGHPLYENLLCSLRRLGNGASFQDLDDQARMSPESQRKIFLVFLKAVRTRFGPRYLNREPTVAELQGISDGNAARGFPACVGSFDCMKLHWKNCPRALKGQFHNPKEGKLAVISCEAVTDGDLYCWHWFAGRPGNNNEKTVLVNSPPFMDSLSGRRRMLLSDGYVLDGSRGQWLLYFLGDGAYPRWAIFYLPDATTKKEKYAAAQQVAVRKDVERLFGCQQGCWGILETFGMSNVGRRRGSGPRFTPR